MIQKRETGTWPMIEFRVHRKAETGSTNADALEGAHGDVFVADFQSDGRGRIGHRWVSPPGVNLMCSIVLGVEGLDIAHAATLPLAVGMAARRVTGGVLKWPNDILIGGRKVAGILCERHGDLVVCGIGVNVNVESFPDELSLRATSLKLEGVDTTPLDVLSRMLVELDAVYSQWRNGGFASLLDEYSRYDALKGHVVRVLKVDGDAQPVEGVSRGVQADGTLLVGDEGVSAGEAHVLKEGTWAGLAG